MIRGHVTVDEAADLAAVSPATIRRWCDRKQVRAVKVGRQWLVDPASLPAKRASASQLGRLKMDACLRALRQLRTLDLREVWVPDILKFEDYLREADWVARRALDRVDDEGPFDPAEDIPVPKSSFFVRSAHLLSLEDRVAYQALVGALTPYVEEGLSESVFSARMATDFDNRLLADGVGQWLKWRGVLRSTFRDGHPWMVKTDISSYFDAIPHPLLFRDIDQYSPDGKLATSLKRMLSHWALVKGQGIPQGPDASRVLGNAFLIPVDQIMDQGPWRYSRYMDDIRIQARSRSEAIQGLQQLDAECKRRGLVLSTQKTELIADDRVDEYLVDHELDLAAYVFNAGRYREAGKLLRKILKESVVETGLVLKKARFSLWRLHQIRDVFSIATVLNNLENFGPVADIVAAYLQPHHGKRKVRKALSRFLNDAERNTSSYLSSWLLAAVIDSPHAPDGSTLDYAFNVASDPRRRPFERILAANVLARGERIRDVLWLEDALHREFNPFIARGLCVAAARCGALSRPLRKELKRRHPTLVLTLNYLEGRQSLPSLTYTRPSSRVT